MANFYNGRYYYKVDVTGKYGYSFMVSTANELSDEYEVINIANGMDCFECSTDAQYAIVDDLVTERDIEHFVKCECCYNHI